MVAEIAGVDRVVLTLLMWFEIEPPAKTGHASHIQGDSSISLNHKIFHREFIVGLPVKYQCKRHKTKCSYCKRSYPAGHKSFKIQNEFQRFRSKRSFQNVIDKMNFVTRNVTWLKIHFRCHHWRHQFFTFEIPSQVYLIVYQI